MSAVQPLIAGALGLCLLEVALTSKYAPARLVAAAGHAPAVLARIVDPSVPLFGPVTASTTADVTPAAVTPAAATTPSSVPTGAVLA